MGEFWNLTEADTYLIIRANIRRRRVDAWTQERFRRLQQLPTLADAREGNLTGTGSAAVQTPDQMLRIAEQINRAMGGEDKRPGRGS